MTFKDLQDEVIAFRWNETYRTRVKGWINTAYENLWNLHEWHFKRVAAANLTIAAGDNTPTMPSDFEETRRLYDHNGDPLDFYPPDEWELRFLTDVINDTRGDPGAFTVIDRQIHLAPIPSVNRTFKLPYRRRFTHIHTDGNPAIGQMVEDLDKPLWIEDHHRVLVYEAMLLGLGGEQDPERKSVQETRDALYGSMLTDLGPDRGGGPVQYGLAYGY